MTDERLPESELQAIEERATAAFDVLPQPWMPWLETLDGIGGCSFIAAGDGERDIELYLDVRLGGETAPSPDPRLDAVVHFVGAAGSDVPRLVAEVRRLRALLINQDSSGSPAAG